MTVKLAQITDTHLLPDREAKIRGLATWHSLRAVLDRVVAAQPDVLVLTGDLANDGDREAYDHLYELVSALKLPTYWLPGNHDNLEVACDRLRCAPFQTVLNERIDLGDWNLILLDSTFASALHGEGRMSAADLGNLREQLAATDRPTAIALHHHPIALHINWLDTIGVTNGHELIAQLVTTPVKLVMFGHTHLELDVQQHGIQFYSTPSTCHQVLREDADASHTLPGFRWLELYSDGLYNSHVVRVPEAIASRDRSAC